VRETARTAGVAVLAVLAVAVAAATLDSTVTSQAGGGDGWLAPGERPQPAGGSATVPVPALLIVAIGVLALLAVLAYIADDWRQWLKAAVPTVVVVGAILLLGRLLAGENAPLDAEIPPITTGSGGVGGGSGTGAGSGAGTLELSPPLVLAAALGIGLVGLALVAVRGDSAGGNEENPGEEEAAAAAVGRAAGRAADRLEDGTDLDNEVYRAWREMTDLLDVDRPAASTPGEFAEAAVAAGLGRADVEDLTRLFEDARYGGREPTADEEGRAVETLRRIERRYADGASDGAREGEP
jgi:hypothetical protein